MARKCGVSLLAGRNILSRSPESTVYWATSICTNSAAVDSYNNSPNGGLSLPAQRARNDAISIVLSRERFNEKNGTDVTGVAIFRAGRRTIKPGYLRVTQ